MTTKREMVEILTREGESEAAALFAAMTDDEYAACTAHGRKVADIVERDPLMRLELDNAVEELER